MPATIAQLTPHQPDEDFINKSLLASLDAQADAEPMSSSEESDHPLAHSYGSTSNSSSSGSPSVNYPISVHSHHHHLTRPDSPSDNPSHNPYQTLRSQESLYFHQTHNGLYSGPNHTNNLHKHNDYPDEYESANGFTSSNYRNSFNSYPNTTRSRHQTALNSGASYRDSGPYYGNDMFPGQMTSPVQSHMQAYDPRAYDYANGHPSNAHKAYHSEQYGTAPSSLVQPSHHNTGKPTQQQGQQPLAGFAPSSQFTNAVQLSSQTPYGPHVPANVAMSGSTNPSVPPGLSGSGSLNMANGANTTVTGEEISTIFVVGFPEDMQEREFQNMFTFSPGFEAATLKIPNKEYTAYGGVLGAGPSSSLNGVNGLRPAFQAYGGQNDPYNLVTVNQGGVVVDGGRDGTMTSWPTTTPLADDLTPNQHFLSSAGGLGGINGLAGVTAAAAAGAAANANLPPRKQIIGFAKFRSREEALVARDVLQGRRVDIEKGAVLKAEMAKKNLHTKRGVGPVPGVSVGPGPATTSMQQPTQVGSSSGQPPLQQHMGMDSFGSSAESAFSSREHRESVSGLPALARLGWRDSVLPNSQQPTTDLATSVTPTLNGMSNGAPSRGEEEDRRRDSVATTLGTLSLSGSSPAIGPSSASGSIAGGSTTSTLRGPRERAEEDDRERRKKDKDQKEMNLMRLRASNSAAFDAFHAASSVSVIGMSRQNSSAASQSGTSTSGSNSTHLTPSSTAPTTVPTESVTGSSPMIPGAEPQQQPNQQDEIVGPWDRVNTNIPVGRPSTDSQRSMSPTPQPQQQSQQYRTQSESSQTSDFGASASQGGANPLGHIGSRLSGNVVDIAKAGGVSKEIATWPAKELALNGLKLPEQHHLQLLQQEQLSQQQPVNGAVVGGGSASGTATASSGSNGNTSPTLPSPASGGSSSGSASTTSASLRGTVDQNPPINTLYVGNLPTSPPPIGYQADHLEDTLRDVFSQRPGYRKLCFRHKAAGPMCFVEFEDVHFATKALAEMSGHTLGGAVKNGIRLSYSKNPLGVRTPTSAGGSNSGGPTLQQQQQLMQTLSNHHHAQFQRHGAGGSDSFQTRLSEEFSNQQHPRGVVPPTSILRRDSTMAQASLQGAQPFGNGSNNPNSFLSSPPPRFYSTSPGGMPFASSTPLTGASSAFIPRSAGNGVGGHLGGIFGGNNGPFANSPPSFSPFGAFSSGGGEGPFAHPPPQQHFQHSIPNEQQQLGHSDD